MSVCLIFVNSGIGCGMHWRKIWSERKCSGVAALVRGGGGAVYMYIRVGFFLVVGATRLAGAE